MTFISDSEASSLIQAFPITSSEVTDASGSSVNELSNGDTLTHHCDVTKPLGWEHTVVAPADAPLAPDAVAAAPPVPDAVVPVPAPDPAAVPVSTDPAPEAATPPLAPEAPAPTPADDAVAAAKAEVAAAEAALAAAEAADVSPAA